MGKKFDFMRDGNSEFFNQFGILEEMPDFIRKDMAEAGEFDEEKFYEEVPCKFYPEP
jgi:hypothetical protein